MKKKYKLFLFFLIVKSFYLVQAQSKTIVKLNHIAVYVQNLERSTKFYKEILLLPEIPEPFHDNRHTWFSVGTNIGLHLIAALSNEKIQPRYDINSHICFSTNDLNGLIKKLNLAKISYRDWAGTPNAITKRVDGVQQIYFQDPDGNWIEVNDDTN